MQAKQQAVRRCAGRNARTHARTHACTHAAKVERPEAHAGKGKGKGEGEGEGSKAEWRGTLRAAVGPAVRLKSNAPTKWRAVPCGMAPGLNHSAVYAVCADGHHCAATVNAHPVAHTGQPGGSPPLPLVIIALLRNTRRTLCKSLALPYKGSQPLLYVSTHLLKSATLPRACSPSESAVSLFAVS